VRGARGTLWSSAGNSLDVASLGVALMRASGVPAQYAQGTLSPSQAQQLILSMFPTAYQVVGNVPAGTPTAEPANDPQLLSESEPHYWLQIDTGTVWQDLDPLMARAMIGQTFTTATGTFATVPDQLEETTEVQLVAEVDNTADTLFGQSGLTDTTVLDQTFDDVELVGRPLTIGNFVTTSSVSAVVSATTNTYSPYIDMSDEAYAGPSHDEVIPGKAYQELITSFPLGSQILTGLFLNITLNGPQGPAETDERTLFDRIGYVARRGLAPVNVSVSPASAPALSSLDAFTLNIMPSLQDTAITAPLMRELDNLSQQIQNETASGSVSQAAASLVVGANRLLTTIEGAFYLENSDLIASQLGAVGLVKAHADRPREILTSVVVVPSGSNQSNAMTASSIDLRRDGIRALAYPGQYAGAVIIYNLVRGTMDSALESLVLPPSSAANGSFTPVNAFNIFQAASAQGVSLAFITSANLTELDALNISAEAKARISSAVGTGQTVLVPRQSVTVNGVQTVGWFETDPNTGETIGVTEDGGHQGSQEYGAILTFVVLVVGVILYNAIQNIT
jgi:hypothetical protein